MDEGCKEEEGKGGKSEGGKESWMRDVRKRGKEWWKRGEGRKGG